MDITGNDTEKQDSTRDYGILQEMGDCYASVGNYAEAHKCYEKAASLGPDEPGPYVGLGVLALQQNQLDDAEISFRVACRLDANCSKAYAGLAMVAQEKADYKRAFEMYLRSKVIHYLKLYLHMHPGDTSVMFPLAALYMKDGRLEQSQKILLEVLTLDPDNEDAANLLEEVEHGLAKAKQAGVQVG
jgi:tetratricopeptide (TPR) repeat protein